MDIWKELRDEGVDSGLLDEVRRFREAHPLAPEAQERARAEVSLLRQGGMGERGGGAAVRRAPAAGGAEAPPVRTCWRRTWRRCSDGRCGTCPCM